MGEVMYGWFYTKSKNRVPNRVLILIGIVLFGLAGIMFLFPPIAYASNYKIVTDTKTSGANSFPANISYNDGTYSGILGKDGQATARVVSGSYTPGDKKTETTSVNTGTSYPSYYYLYNQYGYTGTLERYRVENKGAYEDYGQFEIKTETRDFVKYGQNMVTNNYDKNGKLTSSTYSWDGKPDHPTYEIKEDGYFGVIPRTSTGILSGPSRTNHADGSYSIVTTYWATYTGTLSKDVKVWVPNLQWVDNYTGYYSGEVVKAAQDTRVWEYTQRYRGAAYTIEATKQNYGNSGNTQNVNEPVNIVTGNYYSSQTDMSISEIGLPLEITRYYNSLDTRMGIIGKSWRISYESNIEVNQSKGTAAVTYPDGHTVTFTSVLGSNGYTSPEMVFDQLTKNIDGTYKLVLQNKMEYSYDLNGKLTSITDRNGNYVTISYDTAGRITTVTGAGGKSLRFAYDSSRLKSITDPIGRTIEYAYDIGSNLTQVKGIGGGLTNYEYNSMGLRSITDQNGKKFIVNEYDEFKRVILQYDENGNIIQYFYDDANMENSYTFLSTGKCIKYKYNEKLYVTRITYNDGTYEAFAYDEWGNKNSIRDRNGNTTTYKYDARGNLLAVTLPEPYNYVTTYEYNSEDLLTSIRTPGGSTTTFTYDSKGNLIQRKTKLDTSTEAITEYSYDSHGRLLSIKDAEGGVSSFEYGNHNSPTKMIDAEGNVFEYEYDSVGRRTAIKTAYGTTEFSYNILNKLEKVVDTTGNITRMKYDPVGNLIKLIKPQQYIASTDDGIGYEFRYDGMDRLLQQVDPLKSVTAYKYDEEGRKIKEIGANEYNASTDDGTGMGFSYDADGRLTKVTYPSGQQSRIKYDPVGNRIKLIDANQYDEELDDGPGIQYSYDQLNRLMEVRDTFGNVVKRIIYDSDGRVIKAIDAKGYLSGLDDSTRYGTLYKYNLAGWLLEKRVPVKIEGGQVFYSIEKYEYDKIGRITSEFKSPQYVSAIGAPDIWNTIQYTYDKNGRVKTISDSTGAYMEYSYDSMGNTVSTKSKIDKTRYKITGYHYDSQGRMDRQWMEVDGADLVDGSAGKVKAEVVFEYDRNGNIIKVTRPEGYVTTFEYDAADRLIAKHEEVSEDKITIKGSTASIVSSKNTLYPGQVTEYKIEIQPDSTIHDVDMTIEYDARLLELISAIPALQGISVDTSTLGKVKVSAPSVSISSTANIGSLVFKVREGVGGTGYVTIDTASNYKDSLGEVFQFVSLNGKAAVVKTPDMNGDGSAELNDFTVVAQLVGIDAGNPEYDEKFDVDGSGIIDTPDLDYIKDYLFANESSAQLVNVELARFYEKTTHAAYKTRSETVIRSTLYEYDKAGNLIKETDCNGKSVKLAYDSYQRLISTTDRNGAKSRMFYDEAGNIIKEVTPQNYNSEVDDGPGTVYTYDSMNRLVQITDASGTTVQRNIYDIGGALIKSIDAVGYLSAASDTVRYGVEYVYDIGGRLTQVITPVSKQRGKVSESYSHDALGSVLTYTDGEGNVTSYERDLWGRANKIIKADGTFESYTYDLSGNIASTTDGKGQITRYQYNSMNLLSLLTDPLGQTESYKYDKEGRLAEKHDRNGKTVIYRYNRDNGLTRMTAGNGEEDERYLYNKDGSLLAGISHSGVDIFEYNVNGQISKKTRNGKLVTAYEYNKDGAVTKVTDDQGNVTGYVYDALGRINSVLDGTNPVALYSYNKDSTLASVLYGAGVIPDSEQNSSSRFSYDRDKNITSITHKNAQGRVISQYSYTYDNNSNRLTETINAETTSYAYDSLNRLKTVDNPQRGLESFTYDKAGNRIERSIGEDVTNYQYDANNRLIESENHGITTSYRYDNKGNLVSESSADKTKTYTYDGFDRLKEVINPDGTWMSNGYDTTGMRVSTIENGLWHGYIFDAGSVIGETDARDKMLSRNIRGLGLIARKDTKGNTAYFLHNAHGDVANLVSEAGEILNSYTYDAFGNTLSKEEKVSNRFLYAGEQYDDITDQYYLRARYYSPSIGRFTQEDTFRGDGLNLYAYVANNPIMYIDPSGHTKDQAGYTGNSLTDYLKIVGVDSSPEGRRKLALAYGITNYTGTPAQNEQLLNIMKNMKLPYVDNAWVPQPLAKPKDGPTIGPDPFSAIRKQAIADVTQMLDPILAEYHCGFWHGGGYFLAEDSYPYWLLRRLKDEVSSYKFFTSALDAAIVPASIYDAYEFIQEMGGAPPQYMIPVLAVISLAKMSDNFFGTHLADDGNPDASGTLKAFKEWFEETKGVATALVKFNYVMGTDYRYLMLGFEGRGVFLEQLEKLKDRIQNQNITSYSGAEKEAYKAAMIDYINKIYNMNKNFSSSNAILIEKLEELAKSVTNIDAKDINEKL